MVNRPKMCLLEAHRQTKMLWVMIMFIGILMILPMVSSFNWDGIVSYWKLDGNGLDSAGTTTLNGSTNWTTGIINNGIGVNKTDYLSNLTMTKFPLNQNVSISLWVKFSQINYDNDMFGMSSGEADTNFDLLVENKKIYWTVKTGVAINSIPFPDVTTNVWYHLVGIYNGTDLNLYKNGILNATTPYAEEIPNINNTIIYLGFGTPGFWVNGTIDEVGLWNRGLNSSEVAELYNSGAGLAYGSDSLSVTNSYPATGSNFVTRTVNFGCNLTATGTTKINSVKLNVTGTINWTQTITGLNTKNYNATFTNTTIPYGNYSWNCLGFGDLANGTSTTWTFNVTNLFENSQTYNNRTTEGNAETLSINLTYDSTSYPNIVANLIYNYTLYSATKSGSGDDIIFTKSVTAPTVTADKNVSFYWNIGLINSTGTYYTNTTSLNQTVLNLGIDDCTAYGILVLNYTMRDERTQALINRNLTNASVEINLQVYPVGSSTVILNLSKSYGKTSALTVCLESALVNNSQYSMYVQTKYSADDYVTRDNYLQNFLLKNSTIPQHINLFDLLTTQATQFQITYKNEVFIAVPDALISINREYVSENAFKTVEIAKTDQYGKANVYFDLSGVNYQIIISKDGTNLTVYDNVNPYCNDYNKINCPLSLSAIFTGGETVDFKTYQNLNYAQVFNQTTRTYSMTFSTMDSSVATISINLTKFDMRGNQTICSSQVTTSSGVLTCNVASSYQNISFIAEIYMDGKLISSAIYSITPMGKETFAGVILVAVLGLVLCFALFFIPSTIGVIIGTIIGVGIASVLFIMTGSPLMGGSFMFLIIAGGIIIWRLRSGGSD